MSKKDSDKKQIFFNKLSSKELEVFFKKILSEKPEFKVWDKDTKFKYSLIFISSSVQKSIIFLRSMNKSNLPFINQEVFCNTFLDGKPYFAKAKLDYDPEKNLYLIYLKKDNVYKCERRNNFRLNTYMKHECYVVFQREILKREDIQDDSQVILKAKTNTQLLKNFLAHNNEESNDQVIIKDDESQAFKAYDLSVSGVSFIVSKFEKDFFLEGSEFDNIIIYFNEEEYDIEKANVVSVREFNDGRKNDSSMYKIAFNFEKISHQSDELISRQINVEISASDLRDLN